MGNKLPDTTYIGTIGELLVQLRLLEYGVQAAPPIKDSGNDLIAVKGEVVRYIQVKTSVSNITQVRRLPDVYHLVILVELVSSEETEWLFDDTNIYVFGKGQSIADKQPLTQELVDELWRE